MSKWHLADRMARRSKRRLLSLDGGGIRGVLTLQVLQKMEAELATRTGANERFRLCHFFDYVGGTSTGAIIAAGIATGMSVAEILKLYETLGPKLFQRAWPDQWLKSRYTDGPLLRELKGRFGMELGSDALACLLLVVTRNATTDSPWPVSSNPFARYSDRGRLDCNLSIPLWQLVRASTAAPVYFPAEVVELDPRDERKTFVFHDGGITPYNNPAFLLYRMATLPPYNLKWPADEERMLLVSVGTGSSLGKRVDPSAPDRWLWQHAAELPEALMNAASVDQDINCRTIGRCVHGAVIDREIGDLVPRTDGAPMSLETPLHRAFVYARYDADLSEAGLRALGLSSIEPKRVARLDAVDGMADLARIGQAVAAGASWDYLDRFVEPGM